MKYLVQLALSLDFLFKYIFCTSGQLMAFYLEDFRVSLLWKSRFLAFACGFFLASNNFGWSSGHRFCETDVQANAYITLGL